MNRRQMLHGAVAAAALSGLGAACEEPSPGASLVDAGTPEPTPSPTPGMPAAPLSGTAALSAAAAARGALAVPIRVTPTTTPDGLAAADIIFQEYAESGSLHLAAVFQSRDAAKIGPVAEIRPVDVRALTVLRPFVGYAGGPTGFRAQFDGSGLKGATPDGQGPAFDGDYTSTAALYELAPAGAPPPSAIFYYAAPDTPLAGLDVGPAAELSVAVPGRPPQVWRYDAPSTTWRGRAGRATVSSSSVFVLTMPYRTLSVRKPSVRSLPGARVFGEGAATVVSGPSAAGATWRKPGQKLVCHVLDLAGNQVRPLPGPAWVVYAPSEARVTVR